MFVSTSINATQHPLMGEWWQLYEEAFPATERRSFPQHAAAMLEPAFHCVHLADENGFAGIMAYWQWEELIYLEHLAIAGSRRSQGLGHQALEMLAGNVIVEIEPAVDADTVRRLSFYESCGFLCLPHSHVQLAYQKGYPDIELWLLSRPAFSDAQVERCELLYHSFVMRYRDEA